MTWNPDVLRIIATESPTLAGIAPARKFIPLWLLATTSLLASLPGAAYGQNTEFAVLHNFAGFEVEFVGPGPLVQDNAGNLYGVLGLGGSTGSGVVFELAPSTGQYTVLYTFPGGTAGAFPEGVIRDSLGNFYGVTLEGGKTTCQDGECGVVFEVSSTGVETVLHGFSNSTGSEPLGSLVADTQGNLYGTTSAGGPLNYGVVYQVDGHGVYTVLHVFGGSPGDGGTPGAGLLRDQAGNLYGTTEAGGSFGFGTVFELSPDGTYTILHSFDGTDGSTPYAPLISDAAGNLYGSAAGGGANSCGNRNPLGCGVLFKLDTARNYSVLYNFGGGVDGDYPTGKMYLDATSGDLYGSTYLGGFTNPELCHEGCGTIFKLDPSGNKTILHTFAAHPDGGAPYYGVTARPAQNGSSLILFGITQYGGKYDSGTSFGLTVPE